jgi:hypothetical protein
MTKNVPHRSFLGRVFLPGLFLCLVFSTLPQDAFAQVGTVGTIFERLADQFSTMAGTMAFFCYLSGAVLGFTGLLNLRAYGDDPSSVPFRSIIIKFALGAFLISLPFAIQIAVATVTGVNGVNNNQGLNGGGRPCLMQSSGLMKARGRGTAACP